MLITRWQAPIQPTHKQATQLFELEGLEPFIERFHAGEKIPEHRHPFSEVRFIIEGELLLEVAGNQTLLRPGDRIEIPSNTRHRHQTHGQSDCVCLCAHRIF